MNPSSHCRKSIFQEEFKFQYVRGENIILIFLSKWYFTCSVNMEVSPNIWNRNSFQTTNESIGSLKDESCTIVYISQLN